MGNQPLLHLNLPKGMPDDNIPAAFMDFPVMVDYGIIRSSTTCELRSVSLILIVPMK